MAHMLTLQAHDFPGGTGSDASMMTQLITIEHGPLIAIHFVTKYIAQES